MPRNVRTLTWQGVSYCFARIPDVTDEGGTGEWAVAHAGEFIGTMPCAVNITTGEFEVRCLRWLSELLG
jgi:hypothetical protein